MALTPTPGEQLGRAIIEMIGEFHADGFESLYLDPVVSPSGSWWRFEIGAMHDGQWPRRTAGRDDTNTLSVRGSVAKDGDHTAPWIAPDDPTQDLATRFRSQNPDVLEAARVPNAAYRRWYQQMLDATRPYGLLIFASEMGPCYEIAYCMNEPHAFEMPIPPGWAGDAT
jgi:hypothetical protein